MKLLAFALLIGTVSCRAVGAPGLSNHAAPLPPTVLNHREFASDDESEPYTYVVAGHLYGSPRNKRSIFPAASLLGNLDAINRLAPAFVMSLGDTVRQPAPLQLKAFRTSFLDRVNAPVLNAVGNHEMVSRERYLAEYPGPTEFAFTRGRVLHIVVDTELDVGRISGDQLARLLQLLHSAEENDAISSVAIYGHKALFAVGREEFEIVARHLNSPIGYQPNSRFNQVLLPALRRLAETKQVTWFAGDIGCAHSLPLFFAREAEQDLTWIATGLGDTEADALILVDVAEDGRMSFRVLPLDGSEALPLETFDAAYWQAHFPVQ